MPPSVHMPPPGHPVSSSLTASTSTSELFGALAEALGSEGVEEELCQVGGAVLRIVFQGRPGSRRPDHLFGDVAAAKRAEDAVAERHDLSPDWVDAATRQHLGDGPGLYDAPELRVFQPPPDYVLAMKSAALRFAPDSNTSSDVRYLLMYLGIRSPEQAVQVVDRYLGPRQRPDDLEDRMAELLP